MQFICALVLVVVILEAKKYLIPPNFYRSSIIKLLDLFLFLILGKIAVQCTHIIYLSSIYLLMFYRKKRTTYNISKMTSWGNRNVKFKIAATTLFQRHSTNTIYLCMQIGKKNCMSPLIKKMFSIFCCIFLSVKISDKIIVFDNT